MIRQIALILVCTLMISCANQKNTLDTASRKYRETRDYASLEVIYKNISLGMSRRDVEKLLGEPDYSPTEGLFFYSSSERRYSEEQNRDVVIGLVVDYRDKGGELLNVVSKYYLGPIGE